MPWGLGPSVSMFEGKDCWRTWFFLECEEHMLFGVTEKHLPLITKPCVEFEPYKSGTKLLLEDAPYYHEVKGYHRVCGPYEVFALSSMPDEALRTFPKIGEIIVYKEANPEKGPWLNRSVKRRIDGMDVRYRQMASKFEFFPYRFAIRRSRDWKARHVKHLRGCPLCK